MSTFPRDVLLKAKWGKGSVKELHIEIIDRGPPSGLSILHYSDYMILGRSFITTEDGTMIPYHRMTRIFDERGDDVWVREKERSRDR